MADEPAIAGMTFEGLLGAVAAKTPAPGGGAVASAVGALAAALAQMVVAYTTGKKAYAAHEPELARAVRVLENARAMMLRLAQEDAAAYGEVNELSRLPENDPRRAGLPAARRAAVQAPMATIAAGADLLRLFDRLSGMTNRHLRSDLAIAAVLAEAAARSSWWNVSVNAGSLPAERERAEAMAQADAMVGECRRLAAKVESACGA
jgi:formiminotetrahydrofolate cyclodeaminase